MTTQLTRLWETFTGEIPRFGVPGSRSARLHHDRPQGMEPLPPSSTEARVFYSLRWLGTVGAMLIAVGGLGAGALPVVQNPFFSLPLGSLMGRMLHTSSAITMTGVAILVTAWLLLAPLVGIPLWNKRSANEKHDRETGIGDGRGRTFRRGTLTTRQLWATYVSWMVPLIATAPLFTQDIYSYLAQGSIVAHGMDPYAAGPVELLGADNELARSVPFIWANSPSPYGPVALGIAAAISSATNDSIFLGIVSHRVIAIAGTFVAGWALVRLARRCCVSPSAALWLGILNPLSILHLVGGIHNEAIMLGFVLAGVEFGLAGLEILERPRRNSSDVARGVFFFVVSSVLISCAGMVKVTGFIALGFTGIALARLWRGHRRINTWGAVALATVTQVVILVLTVALITALTGIGLGWITAQGGAATVRSWLSLSTAVGIAWGFIGMLLGLGDQTEAMLAVTRTAGILVALVFLIRMLRGTLRGIIHPLGGLGVATFVLVIFFPVVHPWYILWAVFPLAAWANRYVFRVCVMAYSALMSVMVLPRGLGLPPTTVLTIYVASAAAFIVILWLWHGLLTRFGARVLH